jgi:hypothetical protein
MPKASEKPLLALIEAGGVMPVPAAPAHVDDVAHDIENPQPAMQIVLAIATLKMAGYRVVKPRPKQYSRKGKHKDRVGPTIVCQFADGVVTRMSVFTSLEKLDWDRGVRLSQAAWVSRWRMRERKQRPYWTLSVAPVPPAIVSARFEQDGKILGTRP